jgi:hypothetical protein
VDADQRHDRTEDCGEGVRGQRRRQADDQGVREADGVGPESREAVSQPVKAIRLFMIQGVVGA